MLSLTAILFVGLVLGMRHAMDPDHVVAITTIVTRQRGIKRAALIGALWGIGHTFTIFVVGALIILCKVTIPARLGLSMEFTVAVMLIILGILSLTGSLRQLQERFLTGAAGDAQRLSQESIVSRRATMVPRFSEREATPAHKGFAKVLRGIGAYALFRPLVVGIVHGLAGSAAVALLVMATIHDSWWAIAYLLIFGVGTVVGMVLITTLIAMPFTLVAPRFSGLNRGLCIASALISVGFGLFLSFQIGIQHGLFTGHVHWIPQ